MKKLFRLLPIAGLLVTSAAATVNGSNTPAKPIAVASQCPTYADGLAQGESYKASLAATYGAGTPEYYEALDAAIERGIRNARTAECPTYWRGYVSGLEG